VLTGHSSLCVGVLLIVLGTSLHCGHMERFTYLENTLLRRRSVVHLGGGHQALDSYGVAWIPVWRLGVGLGTLGL
jgi:hypothetical protein